MPKWKTHFTYMHEVINCGTPCDLTISLINNEEILVASFIILQAIKGIIFENRSTTTKIESNLLLRIGSPMMKSMHIFSQMD